MPENEILVRINEIILFELRMRGHIILISLLNTSDDELWRHKEAYSVNFPKPINLQTTMIFDTNRTTIRTSYIEMITEQVSSSDRPKHCFLEYFKNLFDLL